MKGGEREKERGRKRKRKRPLSKSLLLIFFSSFSFLCLRPPPNKQNHQRYFGTAVGKGRQAAKTEIERLNLKELKCEQALVEVAKM